MAVWAGEEGRGCALGGAGEVVGWFEPYTLAGGRVAVMAAVSQGLGDTNPRKWAPLQSPWAFQRGGTAS